MPLLTGTQCTTIFIVTCLEHGYFMECLFVYLQVKLYCIIYSMRCLQSVLQLLLKTQMASVLFFFFLVSFFSIKHKIDDDNPLLYPSALSKYKDDQVPCHVEPGELRTDQCIETKYDFDLN